MGAVTRDTGHYVKRDTGQYVTRDTGHYVTRYTGHYVTRDIGYQPLTVLGRIVQLCALLHNTQPLRIFSTDHISEPVNIPSVVQ